MGRAADRELSQGSRRGVRGLLAPVVAGVVAVVAAWGLGVFLMSGSAEQPVRPAGGEQRGDSESPSPPAAPAAAPQETAATPEPAAREKPRQQLVSSPEPPPSPQAEAPERAGEPERAALDQGILDLVARGEPGAELLMGRLPERRVVLEPRMREGDSWTLSVWYRHMETPDDLLGGPLRWRFEVDHEASYRGQRCHLIRVTLLEVESDRPSAELDPSLFYVSIDHHRLLGSTAQSAQAGKLRKLVLTYSGRSDQAAGAAFSIVPFDLPAVGVEAKAVSGRMPPAVDLGLSSAERERLPSDEDVLGSGGEYLEIEFPSLTDGGRVYQRWWRGDMRWPAVTITKSYRAYRLR